MKRIYLIGAALILLAILGAKYIFSAHRDLNSTGDGLTAAAAQQPMQQAVDNAPTTPVVEPAPITPDAPPCKMVCTPIVRHHRKTHCRTAPAGNGPATGAVTDASFEVEKTHEYTGNKTVTQPAEPTPTPAAAKPAREHNVTTYVKSNRTRQLPSIGIEFGFNQNGLSDTRPSNMNTNSFFAGLLYNIPLSDNITLQPAARYISKGNKLESNMDVTTREKLALHYVEVPVNLVFKFGKPGNARVVAGAGPYVSYLINSEDRFSSSYNREVPGSAPATPYYNTSALRKWDVGAGAFVGVETPEGIFFKAGAEKGFMNVEGSAAGIPGRNYNFLVTFGYVLGGLRQ